MNNIESIMVSVVVPAFNVENDISRCLDSIINQTYTNIEIIIVNDASTDTTRSIIENYIQNDNRVVCIDKPINAGVLQARMAGIDQAKGEYIYSVDSDDYVMPDLVKDTLTEALKHNADIVQFPMKLTSADSKYTHNWTIKQYHEYEKNDFFMHNGNLWTIMFKKELGNILIKYIGSLSVNYHEDKIITTILSAFYKKVRYIDKAYYIYCDTSTSMTRQYSDDVLLKYIRDTLVFVKFMKYIIPIIFPKENTNYLVALVSNRMELMRNQLDTYFKECNEVSIYDLYKTTNENKTFILYNFLHNTIQFTDKQLNNNRNQLKKQAQKLEQNEKQLEQNKKQLEQKEQQLEQNKKQLEQKEQQLVQKRSNIKILLNDRWYRFGQMSKKRKIWTTGKVISKKIKIYWLLQPIAKLLIKILGK